MRPLPTRAARAASLLVLAAITTAAPALADERILDFASDILVATDGGMRVTETIRVRAEGNRIQRGIFRDFPTVYRDRLRNRYVVDFDVESVRRDGASEPWFTETQANGVRLYIGDRDRLLPPGEYTYEIRYRTSWQLGFFPGHDELYWNVNGNGWAFPIDHVSARVVLPGRPGADRISIEGWVGRLGSDETAVAAAVDSDSSARIETTRPLDPGESLTFAMTWPKGIVTEPTPAAYTIRMLVNNRGLLVALAGLALSLFYWLSVWNARGRDPAAGPIFPHYEPPPGVSPASARHVRRMGYDRKAFSAAIINLAVKGYLEIEESDGDYSLRRTGDGTAPLAPGESAILEALFEEADELALDNDNHATVRAAMSAHSRLLRRDNNLIHFRRNSIYTLPAIGILVATALLVVLVKGVSPLAIAVGVVMLAQIPLFAWLMRAHTPAGRRLLDRIEGFRLYLDVAEKDELNLENPPEITPQRFEAFLPYALALDVEQRWAERFNASLAPETAAAYRPAWYHGSWAGGSGGIGNIGAATAAVTAAVTSSIAAAATPPGSSSGSGGGGFAGGGGGGGGGGGW